MIYTINQLKELVTPVAVKYNLPAVYLFGSYARGEATDSSDIDILIDKTGSAITGLFERAALFNDLNEIFSKRVDLVTTAGMEQDSVKRRMPKLAENLNRERVLLYERR